MMKNLFIWTVTMMVALVANVKSDVKKRDTLIISIKGVPQEEQQQINGPYEVDERLRIWVPYIKPVSARGSTSTVARRIEQAYRAAKIYTAPSISIASARTKKEETINLQKVVTVSGAVGRPGPIPYRPGMTLNEAVSTAAPGTFANIKKVELLRKGKVYIYNLKIPKHKTLKVYPKDQINVPERGVF